ncbi:MAG: redoxin domain-containing protein [Bacteroidales bacterium]|nr:redoxin domain-containing protein [Candidatus Hennigimonas equi]
MKNYRLAVLALVMVAGLSSCNKAVVEGRFNAAPSSGIVVAKTLDGASMKVLDTIKVKGNVFKYSIGLEKNQPEFLYLYCGDVKVASLLLNVGDRVSVECDTLGTWTVSGSEECGKLRENELELAALNSRPGLTVKQYVEYYRKMTRYVMENSSSMTVIPVLFSKIGETPVFGQANDAVIFRNIADSLTLRYPDSKYVRMLLNETKIRTDRMALKTLIDNADSRSYPDVKLPGTDGQNHSLVQYADGKPVLLVFWDATDALNKMFNIEVLLPLYEKYRKAGLKIYAVNLNADKSTWAMAVKEQKLPWLNVCDSYGKSVNLFGVTAVPTAIMLTDDTLQRVSDVSKPSLEKAVTKVLK